MEDDRTVGEKVADAIAAFGGSWTFISSFFVLLMIWMLYNTEMTTWLVFDPYPFILLNLVLSCLAAIQAPIIMMSQNRQSKKDRKDAERDLMLSESIEKEVKVLREAVQKLTNLHKK